LDKDSDLLQGGVEFALQLLGDAAAEGYLEHDGYKRPVTASSVPASVERVILTLRADYNGLDDRRHPDLP
jgi:hypothetical protein